MGRGKDLSDHERGKISAWHQDGLSKAEIARRLQRSWTSISHCVNEPLGYLRAKRGRKEILSEGDKRQIHRAASNRATSSRRIIGEYGLHCSYSTVLRALRESRYLNYESMKAGPWSDERIRAQRLAWANSNTNVGEMWKMVFSDEKRFNLDGPDGTKYYWHDLRKERLHFSRRQGGGAGIMFWGGIGALGTTKLAKITGTMNSEKYQNVLETTLLPIFQEISGQAFFLQQDNAPIHVSHSTRQWLQDRNVETLDWPKYSPDLNIIENVWGFITRKVYTDGKQYSNCNDLENAVYDAWDSITPDFIERLFESMPRRVNEVISTKGGPIDY